MRKKLGEDSYQLPRLLPMNSVAMTNEDQALCWSFYDYPIANHTAAAGVVEGAEARGTFPRPAQARWQILFQIEDDWKAWVQATYPAKEKLPRC
ncbi:MAG: hypothetical protein R3F17_03140 [Planctomycetota bacterium]